MTQKEPVFETWLDFLNWTRGLSALVLKCSTVAFGVDGEFVGGGDEGFRCYCWFWGLYQDIFRRGGRGNEREGVDVSEFVGADDGFGIFGYGYGAGTFGHYSISRSAKLGILFWGTYR